MTTKTVEIFAVDHEGRSMSLPLSADDYLEALRELIDFLNQQAGAYLDALAGFTGNKARVELQVARIRRRHSLQKDADGANTVVSSSYEDPSKPEFIISRITRSSDYLAANSQGGFNEQQTARAAIVFIFAYWDEEIRPRLARAKKVSSPNEIQVDEFGDLRLLRRSIIHNRGKLSKALHQKLKVMGDAFAPDAEIHITPDVMHQIFVRLKQGIGRLMLDHVGPRPGAPNPADLKDIAIARTRRMGPVS
jgi:hypothetical protein